MHAQPHVIFVNGLAQSGVGKSRKCCFPHGCRCACRTHSMLPSSPNVLEGRINSSECVSRGSIFQRFLAQIEFSTFEKCFPGKRIRNGLFGLPKSSFGRGEITARCHHFDVSVELTTWGYVTPMCLSNSQANVLSSFRRGCRTHSMLSSFRCLSN